MAHWKKTFISTFTAQVISLVGFSFATPFLPFFISDLGVTDRGEQAFWAGVALAAAGFTFALSAPVWGIMGDRYGRKLMVCRSMFGGVVVLILMSFVRTVGELVACRMLQGLLSGTMAASIALVASVVPQKRSGFTLGMMQAAAFIGTTVGPFVGGNRFRCFRIQGQFQDRRRPCAYRRSACIFPGTRRPCCQRA